MAEEKKGNSAHSTRALRLLLLLLL
ncbi:hypothetical protein CCACVL1_04706 [Corchorus capsularis]|uniref:Uncharacterized protein n=1 Tax=Corchorus capsularis TaxID=210143 RepID=A0A1R3JQ82_COCAP|nr:hypothetical protein CCACVL1_04706 [Corchorus capsularis]